MITTHKYSLNQFLSRSGLDDAAKALTSVLAALPPISLSEGPWVAGGVLRRTILGMPLKDSDIDVFFASAAQQQKYAEALEALGAKVTHTNDFNTEYLVPNGEDKLRVQLIGFAYYADADEVLDSFDYTICQFLTDGETMVVGEYALHDLHRKRLVLHNVTYAVATTRRMLKYTKQGFTACAGMMGDLLERVVANPTSIHRSVEYID